jgi:hypothetical protein
MPAGCLYNFINVSQVCAEFWSEERFKQEFERSPSKRIRGISWAGDWPIPWKAPGMNETMMVEWLRLDYHIFDMFGERKMRSIQCLLQSIPSFPEDKFLFYYRTFFSLIDPESYKTMLGLLPCKRNIAVAGDEIIESLFGREPFIGIHLRSLEGHCAEMTEGDFQAKGLQPFIPEAKEACSPTWDNIKMRLQRINIDAESIQIYLADDGQQPTVTDAILQNHPNVRRLSDFSLLDEKGFRNHGGVLEVYILSHSTAFLGVAASSFAFHVALRRELNGFPKESNLIPGYPETGHMPHFFNSVDFDL